ncbi:MAG: formate dehydrogenase, partial [Haliea sp.]
LLPCLGRIEIDQGSRGEQTLSVEDSTSFMHSSRGVATPAENTLRSEAAIVAGIAQATLDPNPKVPWDAWAGDYARVRDAIEATWPDVFRDFNRRFLQPGGFQKPIAARQRKWNTDTGKANFKVIEGLKASPLPAGTPADALQLTTVRSDDQFNTTVYSLDDRFRGIYGTRMVLMMNRADMSRLGLDEGDLVTAVSAVNDGQVREVAGLRITPYDIPPGCIAGYYPECNPLLPLQHHAEQSFVPAAKSIPVVLRSEAVAAG